LPLCPFSCVCALARFHKRNMLDHTRLQVVHTGRPHKRKEGTMTGHIPVCNEIHHEMKVTCTSLHPCTLVSLHLCIFMSLCRCVLASFTSLHLCTRLPKQGVRSSLWKGVAFIPCRINESHVKGEGLPEKEKKWRAFWGSALEKEFPPNTTGAHPFYSFILLPCCLVAMLPFCPFALSPFCPFALLPFCPFALLSSGPLALWPFGPLALWPFGPLALWPFILFNPFCPFILYPF
jgi:hypothetical protein